MSLARYQIVAISLVIVAATLYSAYAIIAFAGEKVTICHATYSLTNPYEEISVSLNALDEYMQNKDNIIPAPPEGCHGTIVD